MRRKAFTLVEVVIVVAVLALLFSMVGISFSGLFVNNDREVVLSEIRERVQTAYVKATTGTFGSEGGVAQKAGVYFGPDRVVFFLGDTYVPGEINNEEYILPSVWRLSSIELINSTLLFSAETGEIEGWGVGTNGFQIERTEGTDAQSYEFNQWGVLEER
jgi:prepilin-type N-terminal cleavage/methylation domain-containing protein